MKARTYFFAAMPVVALLAAGFGGCGGDDSSLPDTPIATSTTETTGALTKADLLQQGDDVCAEVNAAIGAVDESSVGAADKLSQQADLYSGMIERLQGLGNPDDAAGLQDVYSAGTALVQASQDSQLAAQRSDAAGLTSAESAAASALISFQDAASAYGFEECGKAPTPPQTSSGTPTSPVAPVAPATTTPAAPVTPAPAPAPAPAPPTGAAGGTGGGSTGGGTGGTGGGSSGGVGPG